MDETAIRRRAEELLSVETSGDHKGSHHVFQGALTLLAAVYGPGSPQIKDLETVGAMGGSRGLPAPVARGMAAKGALENLRGDLDAGVVGSLRAQMAGGVIADFLQLSRFVLEESGDGAKNVAAVLTAAAYEDTIRRMGADLAGVIDRPNLASVLEELKNREVLREAQFTIAQSYLKFRNDALHADWENVNRESVAAVLAFVEQLILKHFS